MIPCGYSIIFVGGKSKPSRIFNESQYPSLFFLNELGGKKHVFNMDSYFLSFYSVISIHPLFFSQSIKIVGLSTSAAGVNSVSLIRAVTFHPQQKKTPPPPRTLKQYFSKCGELIQSLKMCHQCPGSYSTSNLRGFEHNIPSPCNPFLKDELIVHILKKKIFLCVPPPPPLLKSF